MVKKLVLRLFYGKHFYLLMAALSFGLTAFSQQTVTLKGMVSDSADNKPMTGVSVLVSGTSTGTQTGANGSFTLQAGPGSKLIFRFIGYTEKQVTVTNAETIYVKLVTNSHALNDIVVIGYGVQRRKDLTSAISSISAKQLEDRPVQTTESLLQGQAAGLTVTTDGGEPGTNGKVRIRGVGTFGDNNPLYVVDGIPVNNGLNYLNPNDIESIQVLKDAAAAAIYGNRSANGVILVTTKKGKKGERQISFDSYFGIAKNGKVRPMADAQQYWDYVNLKNEQGTLAGVYALGANSDWVKAITRTGINESYNLAMRGGGDDHTYFTSVDYSLVDGTQLKSDNKRLTARLNTSNNLFKWFKINEDLAISNEERHSNNIYGLARNTPSIVPIYKTPAQIAALDLIFRGC